MKQILPVLFLFLLYFCFLPAIYGFQIKINEVSPVSNPEWIELYNNSDESVDISNWKLVDEANHIKIISNTTISAHGYFVYSTPSGWLNNSDHETITLKNFSNEIIDSIIYGNGGIIGIPNENKSIGRYPDGSTNWVDLSWSQGNSNIMIAITSTASPTISLAPTQTPTITQTPTTSQLPKSIYKINTVKDSDGASISNIKIYVDGSYTHHYAPESIIFCNDCHCDDNNEISCGFGSHTISLIKEGYVEWKEQKTFNSGDMLETNPIISKIAEAVLSPSNSSSTPNSPTPTPTSSSTPTVSSSLPSPSLPGKSEEQQSRKNDSTVSSELTLQRPSLVLGQSSDSAETRREPEASIKQTSGKSIALKYTFLFGLVVLSISGSLLYFRHKKD